MGKGKGKDGKTKAKPGARVANLNAMFSGLQKLNAGVLPEDIPRIEAQYVDDEERPESPAAPSPLGGSDAEEELDAGASLSSVDDENGMGSGDEGSDAGGTRELGVADHSAHVALLAEEHEEENESPKRKEPKISDSTDDDSLDQDLSDAVDELKSGEVEPGAVIPDSPRSRTDSNGLLESKSNSLDKKRPKKRSKDPKDKDRMKSLKSEGRRKRAAADRREEAAALDLVLESSKAGQLVREASKDVLIDDLVSFANLVSVSMDPTSVIDEDEIGEKIQRVVRPADKRSKNRPEAFGSDFSAEQKEDLRVGTDKFNQRVNQGVRYLVDKEILEETPEKLADFLYRNPNLSKGKIGIFLGGSNPLNVATLEKFVEKIDFSVLLFDDAVRLFLSHFRLPGEAQQIDRIMEVFAGAYCIANPKVFKNKDTAYILAFSLIMLNTDAHNPNVVKKMSKEQFIKQLQGIETEELSEEFLSYLYNRIVNEEIAMVEEHVDFSNPDMEGWMYKQGGRVKNWKKRFVILSGSCLYYFKDKACSQPSGILPLENLVARAGLKNGQHVRPAKNPGAFCLFNPNHHRVKSAKSEEERQEWMDVIQANMESNPYYGILLEQKRMRMIKSKEESK